jgi:hypothetical protein
MSTRAPSPGHANASALWAQSALAIGACMLASCASYASRTADALADFRRGQFEAAEARFAAPETTDSAFLAGAEAGSAALAAGEFERARVHFDAAALAVREREERGLVSVENAGEAIGTFAFNDTLADYQGEGFERVYLHANLAFCYLGLGRADSALVEARRANQLLEREQELYDSDYAAGGLGHLASAIAYELAGDLADAYIDYKRMLDKGIAPELAGSAAVRLAHQLGREDELPDLRARFGEPLELPQGAASIFVLAGLGMGPVKREVSLPIPTGDGFISWAVPTYVDAPPGLDELELEVLHEDGGALSVRTALVEDVSRVARQNLGDRIAWMTAKSAARGIAKRELTKSLADDHGLIGQIAGDLYSLISERADLRAWQTLPASWQAARVFVPPGVQRLRLGGPGGTSTELGPIELRAGEYAFVFARAPAYEVHAHLVGGRRIAAEASEAAPSASAPALDPALDLAPDASPTP